MTSRTRGATGREAATVPAAGTAAEGTVGGAAWWGVGGVVLVLFVAGNAARYVPPEALWPLQILGLAVPSLGVLLVLKGLAALLVRRWWLAGALFSAFAAGSPDG